MKILVMGAGAIGSVFGGFLAKGGHPVTLVGRSWHMDAIRNHGLRIHGIWGEHRVTNLVTKTSLPEGESFDLALLAVKSYQTEDAVSEMARLIKGPLPVLSLQNGLGNLETIAKTVGPDQTLGGRVIFGAEIKDAGEVTVTVYADQVALGPMQKSQFPMQKAREIAAVIDRCGIPCFAANDIERFIWGKVLYNVALNAPAAILEINYGKLLDHRSTRELMKGIINEAFSVAQALGIQLDWKRPEAYIETLFHTLVPPTASHFPSMLQDIQHGKKTEIDALNGALVRLAEEQGLTAPINQTLTRLIRFKETGLARMLHE